MATRRRLTGKKPLSQTQQHRAETFRLMLLEHNGLKGNDKQIFENAVKNLDQHQLTNLSRQYHKALEVWYDSNGVTTIIAQDLLNRVRQMGRATMGNIVKEIQTGSTKLGANIGRIARQQNLKDMTRQEVVRNLGYKPGKWA